MPKGPVSKKDTSPAVAQATTNSAGEPAEGPARCVLASTACCCGRLPRYRVLASGTEEAERFGRLAGDRRASGVELPCSPIVRKLSKKRRPLPCKRPRRRRVQVRRVSRRGLVLGVKQRIAIIAARRNRLACYATSSCKSTLQLLRCAPNPFHAAATRVPAVSVQLAERFMDAPVLLPPPGH